MSSSLGVKKKGRRRNPEIRELIAKSGIQRHEVWREGVATLRYYDDGLNRHNNFKRKERGALILSDKALYFAHNVGCQSCGEHMLGDYEPRNR